MILNCHQICLSYGTDVILDNISFHIEEQEKAAVVGINGAGKSSLLKIIVGEISADSGQVTVSKGKSIGYLAQHQEVDSEAGIFDWMMDATFAAAHSVKPEVNISGVP